MLDMHVVVVIVVVVVLSVVSSIQIVTGVEVIIDNFLPEVRKMFHRG